MTIADTIDAPPRQASLPAQQKRLKATLHKVFGLDALRPGQEEVIQSVLSGADTLAIMPTGAGKSLCYQLPAMQLDGLTLVVSPLISLMKDQYDKLREADIPAGLLHSSLSAAEERQTLDDIGAATSRFLFVTPERLANPEFVTRLLESNDSGIALVVIDEAHCVSQWGHDFRPAFVEMVHSIKALGRPPLLALTATATPAVIVDILHELDMGDANVFNTGVYRSNLHFAVQQLTNPQEKRAAAIAKVQQSEGAGIVYCATVAECNAVHAALVEAGVAAQRYNGKMAAAERTAAQDAFMRDECRVIVATNAFGMGIDKPDIRFVIHYQMPGSLEAYYQEAGRAGRDGEDANCVLLFELKDKQVQQFFLSGRYPSVETITRAANAFRKIAAEHDGQAVDNAIDKLHEALPDIGKTRLRTTLSLMLDSGMAARTRRGAIRLRPQAADDALEKAAGRYTVMAANDRAVLEKMMGYAQSAQCRWRLLLDYFDANLEHARASKNGSAAATRAMPKALDELNGGVCCQCDNCLNPPAVVPGERELHEAEREVETASEPQQRSWQPGDAVKVRRYGTGTVDMTSGDRVAIQFPDGETRTFLSRFVKAAK